MSVDIQPVQQGAPASTVAAPCRYTPEDLLSLPDADLYELVDGKLVERPRGCISNWRPPLPFADGFL
jgi:hypothetical protein